MADNPWECVTQQRREAPIHRGTRVVTRAQSAYQHRLYHIDFTLRARCKIKIGIIGFTERRIICVIDWRVFKHM